MDELKAKIEDFLERNFVIAISINNDSREKEFSEGEWKRVPSALKVLEGEGKVVENPKLKGQYNLRR